MARFATTIKKTGPFFQHDPALTFRQNADALMAAIASEGESDVKAQVQQAVKTPSEHFLPGVEGRTHRLDGQPFKNPGVVVSQTHVYPWARHGARGSTAGSGAEYRGGKLEARFGMFRRTARRVRAVNKLNSAELLKGINS